MFNNTLSKCYKTHSKGAMQNKIIIVMSVNFYDKIDILLKITI